MADIVVENYKDPAEITRSDDHLAPNAETTARRDSEITIGNPNRRESSQVSSLLKKDTSDININLKSLPELEEDIEPLKTDSKLAGNISSDTTSYKGEDTSEVEYDDIKDEKFRSASIAKESGVPASAVAIDINEAPKIGDPAQASPKFDSADPKPSHLPALLKVLKLDYKKMAESQREEYRSFLQAFIDFYKDFKNFEQNPTLKFAPEAIDLVFDLIQDHRHIALEKLFGVLVILARNTATKAPSKGAEPRLNRIIEFIKANPSHAAVKEAVRSLINYAECNHRVIHDCSGVDVINNQLSTHMQDPSYQTLIIWFFRNLVVHGTCRKVVMDKIGFLIVNSMNSHVQDTTLIEQSCWALGNLALSDDNAPGFGVIGALPAVKNAMVVHASHENVAEAICWFYYNITFDMNLIRALLRFAIEEPVSNFIKKYPTNKNIQTWGGMVVKRIKAVLQANSPQAIIERNANKPLREGPLLVQSLMNKMQKRHVLVQAQRLVWSATAESNEIDGEIRFKEVVDVSLKDDKFITVKTRSEDYKTKEYVFEVPEKSSIDGWFSELKNAWKYAVSSIIEVHGQPQQQPHTGFPMMFNVPETCHPKDLEKVISHHILHEIYMDPHYLTTQFKCQKDFPNITLWDYVATITTKKFTKEFMEKVNAFKVQDKELYDVEKMKKELTKMVEERIVKEVEEFEKNPKVDAPPVLTRYEYCAKQGIRPTMEDKHVHMPFIDLLLDRNKKDEPCSYYAVYDGHGGVSVADYVEAHLHVNIFNHPQFEEDPRKAMAESFMKTQEDLKEHTERLFLSNTAGSTGVVILFKGKKMIIGWVGDSMATMFTKNKEINLVDPHKPGDASEKSRIEKLGGFVSEEGGVMRVNGIVAVSRAFGNLRHKVILPEPDFKEFTLTGEEQYIVLACDGLWDVMNGDSLRKFIKRYLVKNKGSTKGISEALVDESLKLGSTDNVSVIFIEFNWWDEPKRIY